MKTEQDRPLRRTHTAESKAIKLAKKMAAKEDERKIEDFEVTWINPDDTVKYDEFFSLFRK